MINNDVLAQLIVCSSVYNGFVVIGYIVRCLFVVGDGQRVFGGRRRKSCSAIVSTKLSTFMPLIKTYLKKAK
jgi:hypothetical protein